MKIPLNYQITEYDCCPTTFINALNFLYEREEIRAELLKIIYKYTLDCHSKSKKHKCIGTTPKALRELVKHLNKYSKSEKFNLKCHLLTKDKVKIENIKKYQNKNTCFIMLCHYPDKHYILITKVTNNYAYIFDPYYTKCLFKPKDKNIIHINNNPFKYNQKIPLKRLFSLKKKAYSQGEIATRELIILNKLPKMKTKA